MIYVTSIAIHTDFIRLQDLLKLAGAVESGGEAKSRIQSGEALVNGEACTQRGKKLRPGDSVTFAGSVYTVSHAG
jgi:ribosome-associated protein